MRSLNFNIYIYILCFCLCFNNHVNSTSLKAPNFALYNLNGQLITLRNEIKDKNVVIAFFASYCAPCKKEIPELVRIINNNQSRTKLILINVDKEGKIKADEFLNNVNVTGIECLLDIYQVALSNYIPDKKIPAFFLINKKGEIIMKSVNGTDADIIKLEKTVNSLR